jgi:hypothetical protein
MPNGGAAISHGNLLGPAVGSARLTRRSLPSQARAYATDAARMDAHEPLPRPETPVDLGHYSMQLLELVQKGGIQVAHDALREMSLSDSELQEMSILLAEVLKRHASDLRGKN